MTLPQPHKPGPEVVRQLKGRHVLVLGDTLLDRYWWGTVTRISPEAPVPVVHKHRSTVAPGGAANVAANIASLGGIPHLVGLTGRDEPGRELRVALTEQGMSTDGLIADDRRPTTVKTRIVAHNQHVVRVDEEDTQAVNGVIAAQVLAKVVEVLDQCEVVVLSDYAKGLLTTQTLRDVLLVASAKRCRVIVDPKGHDYTRYIGAHLLSPNRQEALKAAGLDYTGPDSVAQAGARLMEQVGLEALLLTQGEAGMTLFQRGQESVAIPSMARSVYDVTGAGDTVIATLALAVAAGVELLPACQLANLAAGLAVEQVGTAAVTAEQLEAELVAGTDAPTMSVQAGRHAVRAGNP